MNTPAGWPGRPVGGRPEFPEGRPTRQPSGDSEGAAGQSQSGRPDGIHATINSAECTRRAESPCRLQHHSIARDKGPIHRRPPTAKFREPAGKRHRPGAGRDKRRGRRAAKRIRESAVWAHDNGSRPLPPGPAAERRRSRKPNPSDFENPRYRPWTDADRGNLHATQR